MWSVSRRAFAPRALAMTFWLFASTRMNAWPDSASGIVAMPSVVILSDCRMARCPTPMASSPSAPMNATLLGSSRRAAATATLAAVPPGTRATSETVTSCPGAGRDSTNRVTSQLIAPTVTTRGVGELVTLPGSNGRRPAQGIVGHRRRWRRRRVWHQAMRGLDACPRLSGREPRHPA